ncbi:MAG: hypothetical protein ACE5OY_02640 [Candidatus Bathyarchaeia archaeon]
MTNRDGPSVWKVKRSLCSIYVKDGYLYAIGSKTREGRLGMVWVYDNPLDIRGGRRGKTLSDYGGEFVMHHSKREEGREWWITRAPAWPLRGKYFKLFRRSADDHSFVTVVKLTDRGFVVLKDSGRGSRRR